MVEGRFEEESVELEKVREGFGTLDESADDTLTNKHTHHSTTYHTTRHNYKHTLHKDRD